MLLFIAEFICSHSFSCRISLCMFTLIFCVGTWLFRPANYCCLMLFDSEQFPQIKKKMLFPNFLDIVAGAWHSLIRVVVCEREKTLQGDGDRFHQRWRLFTETTISHPFAITSVISFYTKKWHHFHSNEVRRRIAQRYHLPIDDYANSYTVHWCNKRKKKRGEKTVIRVSRVFTTAVE